LEDHVPIYEYRCSSCGFQKEYLQKISDPLRSSCPECGRESFQKMLTTAGFQLKGSGWYASDFKNSGAKPQKEKTESAKTTESANATESAKATEPAKAEAPARGAGAGAASSVAESGS
jgi:putative FmdB family regulatory protein